MSMRKLPVSDQRIAFEAWYEANNTSANLVRTAKGYIDNTTRVAWRAWQAAQPAPVQETVGEVKDLFTQTAWEKLDVRGSTKVYLATPLAQPAQQEPVAWMDRDGDLYANEPDKNWCPPHYPLYTTPPTAQRQWVGLTDEEYGAMYNTHLQNGGPIQHFTRAIEAKLKEKNT